MGHDESASTDTEDTAGGIRGGLQSAIKDVLRGESPFYPGGSQAQSRSIDGAKQIQALGSVAGKLDFGTETDRGGEHVIYHPPGSPIAFKKTLPDALRLHTGW